MSIQKIKSCLQVKNHTCKASLALLILRVVAGAAFAMHGWGKIQNPMGWMGPDAPVPGFFQGLAALSEFGGGIGWALGLLTPLCSFGIACTMFVATSMHAFVFKDPFVSAQGGRSYELALVYLSVALVIAAMGPGKLSADQKLFGERSPQ